MFPNLVIATTPGTRYFTHTCNSPIPLITTRGSLAREVLSSSPFLCHWCSTGAFVRLLPAAFFVGIVIIFAAQKLTLILPSASI